LKRLHCNYNINTDLFLEFDNDDKRGRSNKLLSRRSRQRERLSASMLSIRSSVCLSVAKIQKTRFSQKLSNLELWFSIGSRTWAFQITQYWTPKIQDGGDPPSWILMQKGDFFKN